MPVRRTKSGGYGSKGKFDQISLKTITFSVIQATVNWEIRLSN